MTIMNNNNTLCKYHGAALCVCSRWWFVCAFLLQPLALCRGSSNKAKLTSSSHKIPDIWG